MSPGLRGDSFPEKTRIGKFSYHEYRFSGLYHESFRRERAVSHGLDFVQRISENQR